MHFDPKHMMQMLAAKAYDLHNAELQGTGLTINTPETMWNVPLAEVRAFVSSCC